MTNFQTNLFNEGNNLDCTKKLKIIKTKFITSEITTSDDLFAGYTKIKAITFSSGLEYLTNIISKFSTSEIIFGCEATLDDNLAAVMSVQTYLL